MIIKPTPQYDDRAGDLSRDHAGAGAFSIYALERMLRDCMEQPDWRLRAAVCAAYYDGKQLSELQRWHIREADLEERAVNLIRPVINSVLGQEARSRTDVKIEADDDADSDVAEVMSYRLKELERESSAHMAVSEAYASMVKKGLGWVYVGRNSDPLDYPYRAESVPIDEIWWDWRGQRGVTLKEGCRWLVRQRMVDLDELEAGMPEHAAVLRMCVNGWENFLDDDGNILGKPETPALEQAYANESRFNLTVKKWDWVDAARKMLKLYEVWYRVPAQVVVLHMSPTRRVQYDPNDRRHVEAVSRGLVKISKGITSQVRRALYAGPHRLYDEATKKRNFPYIPFFAFRDDEDKSPYGLIDGMVAPQDEYNERRLRIQWMLKARQVQMDSDALDPKYNSIADVEQNAMRPDFMAITNPNRINRNNVAIKIANDLAMQPEQFTVMADSKQLIQDTAGRYASQLGNKPAGVTSGIANSLLIEQGEQSMGEMNDNYSTARRSVFEQAVDEIIADHREQNLAVPIGAGKTRRVVVLNQWSPEGKPVNSVADAHIKTALAEVPNTPAYRQQSQQQVAQIIQALGNNPQAVAVLAPAYVESTSLNNRQQVADDLRRVSGLPMPGDKEGQAQAEAQQTAMQAEQQQHARALAQATLDEKVASAERHRATARKATADAQLVEGRIVAGQVPAEVDKTIAETAQILAPEPEPDEDQLIEDALAEASN
jgi:hypothetical protein